MSKLFSLASVLSLSTGMVLCDFSETHELAEFLTGGPVWTHQFASRVFADWLREQVLAQHPELSGIDYSQVTEENWRNFLDAQIARFGSLVEIEPAIPDPSLMKRSFTDPLGGKKAGKIVTD